MVKELKEQFIDLN